MPRFSAFNPFGALRFSSRKSHGQKFYEDMVKALGSGKNYTTDFDSLAMARVYANAMAFGRCQYTLERASNQFRPSRALELLPALEAEYGLIPEPGSSVDERRSELAVAAWIARGARRANVETILEELFGSEFVQYITVATADAVSSTSDPPSRGVYVKPGTLRSVWRLTVPISTTGAPTTAHCELVTGDRVAPAPGTKFVVDAGDHGRVEASVVVAAAFTGPTAMTVQATFTRPHNAGVLLATGRHSNLTSNKRHNLFLMSAESARDNRTRRRLHRAAHRLLRGVSTWSITDGSGPFRVGVGRLGITTIGSVT